MVAAEGYTALILRQLTSSTAQSARPAAILRVAQHLRVLFHAQAQAVPLTRLFA